MKISLAGKSVRCCFDLLFKTSSQYLILALSLGIYLML